ncbi:YbhB/YbcL family Raf kinase inhibitor-like protein [Demequina sp. TTPB684]|uniref:YbhB/YbcL family Raf kinase inhibitor-like protein n=1 Tax=unclassified Demequina TaxID=2620311 RepID=UPI001CF11825|nr:MULTISPECIES: YbhB/YbcL family Raf kinase inhibitor-like protein [unclassified Demequina]MCB2413459.1 YbhB/YbcL family Raf kinase inhibitor-like protein [Demequina sp. TTPB684]UPU88762.1 YbhB/YbcL family Raf kinase inhibitor-like protein [Demequina sp. TMPB413]
MFSLDFVLSSPDIADGERIDDRFAGQQGAQTPRLSVAGVPEGAVELAVVCHDPDAPLPDGFTHWTLYGLPAEDGDVDVSAGRAGPHDDDGVGYVGPFPPPGHGLHHYYFWVYALKSPVAGTPTRGEFLREYRSEIVGQARLVATYSR